MRGLPIPRPGLADGARQALLRCKIGTTSPLPIRVQDLSWRRRSASGYRHWPFPYLKQPVAQMLSCLFLSFGFRSRSCNQCVPGISSNTRCSFIYQPLSLPVNMPAVLLSAAFLGFAVPLPNSRR
ncbi:hypothetical protein VTK56DRAFT_450 [Thermocarpiscus australiensis]